MPDLIKDIALTFGGALLIERSPAIAKALVISAAKCLPKPFNEIYQQAWLADLEQVDGNLSKLGSALYICAQVPSVRAGHNLPVISFKGMMILASIVNFALAIVLMGADIFLNSKGNPVNNSQFIAFYAPIVTIAYISGIFGIAYTLLTTPMFMKKIALFISGIIFITLFSPAVLLTSMHQTGKTADGNMIPIIVGMALFSVIEGRDIRRKRLERI